MASPPDLIVIDDFVDAELRVRLLAQVSEASLSVPKGRGAQLDGVYGDNPGRHTVRAPPGFEARIRAAVAADHLTVGAFAETSSDVVSQQPTGLTVPKPMTSVVDLLHV